MECRRKPQQEPDKTQTQPSSLRVAASRRQVRTTWAQSNYGQHYGQQVARLGQGSHRQAAGQTCRGYSGSCAAAVDAGGRGQRCSRAKIGRDHEAAISTTQYGSDPARIAPSPGENLALETKNARSRLTRCITSVRRAAPPPLTPAKDISRSTKKGGTRRLPL